MSYNERMRTDHTHNGLRWIDMERPTRDEMRVIVDEFGITPIVAEEILHPSSRVRVEMHQTYAFVILRFPSLRGAPDSIEQEVDFIVGKDFIITIRYAPVEAIHHFSKVFEVNSALETSNVQNSGVYVFFSMMRRLYRSVEHEVERVRDNLSDIEARIFHGEELAMVAAISKCARDLLNMRQAIEPHREIIYTLEHEGAALFGEDATPYLRALPNEYFRVHNHIMRHTESLHELRETNNSLLSTRENETMRTLTIMALLTFPLALLVAILDIDTAHNPVRGMPYDFWIILGSVMFVGVCMITYFKYKRWL